ncbi:MAG: L,D-transpeptidase [Candidatus Limiplasma sp.]|nr:L,D-transpeptidase [Candidatus Limiplasma sp.]
MIRKVLSLLMVLLMLPVLPASADTIAMTLSPSHFAAGETLYIYFVVPVAGPVDMVALDAQGQQKAVILENHQALEGGNELTWDGMSGGQPLPAGRYALHLTQGEQSVDMDITLIDGGDAVASRVSTAGAGDADAAASEPDEAQDSQESGGQPQALVSQNGGKDITPAHLSTHVPDHPPEGCYWCTPMDLSDEAAVWAMLTAPVTVVDGHQKEQYILRAEPDAESEGVGVVTCDSQSVHVLKTLDNGWTLVETYSSSFHDSKVKAWNAFVAGYIPTKKLKTKQVNQEYGMIVDKLTQELYIFKDGRLFTKLLASTGLYNERQPYNETRSGEFLIVSRVGEFRSDNMFCSMALRFNSGDLLHEVPHVKNGDGTKNFKNTEYKLGTRASHGCIRVQRLKNEEGVNMTWVWDNINVGTKMVIWEDFAGRQMDYPDFSTPLYYNPDGGSNYHSDQNCSAVKKQYLPLTAFTYGELTDSPYDKLTPCPYCTPPRSKAEIDEINRIHLTESPGMVPQTPAKKK